MNEQRSGESTRDVLAAFMALKSGAGESTIQEHEQVSVRTRAGLPLAHAGLVSLSFVLISGGLGLAGLSVGRALGWDVELGQGALVGLALAMLAWAVWRLVIWLFHVTSGAPRVFFALFLLAFLVVAGLNAAASMSGNFGWWQMMGLVVGVALALGGVALGYNQGWSLFRPYWRQSPFEEAIMKMLPALFGVSPQAPMPTGTRSLVVHVRDGNRTQILYADILGVDDEQLVAWAQRMAEGRGLSESQWTRGGGVFDGINQYRAFRTQLENAGMVRSTTRGYELTGSGRSLVRRLVEYAENGEMDEAPGWMAEPRFNDEESLAAHGQARFLASE